MSVPAPTPTPKEGKWVDITEIFTEKGVQAIKDGVVISLGKDEDGNDQLVKVGNVLKFRQPLSGKTTNLKIKRLDKRLGKVWAREIEMMDAEEAEMKAQEIEKGNLNRFQRRWIAKRNKQ